jgi:hypothetical protein
MKATKTTQTNLLKGRNSLGKDFILSYLNPKKVN